MRRALAFALTLLALAGPACGSDETGESGAVTPAVEEQLRYLEPESPLAVVLDLRYEEENREHVRPLASRLLRETRGGRARGGLRDTAPGRLVGLRRGGGAERHRSPGARAAGQVIL